MRGQREAVRACLKGQRLYIGTSSWENQGEEECWLPEYWELCIEGDVMEVDALRIQVTIE